MKVTLVTMIRWFSPAMFKCTGSGSEKGKRAIIKERRRKGVEVICKYVIVMLDYGI